VIARFGGTEVRASELGKWFFTTHRQEAFASLSKLIGLRVAEAEARRLGLACPPAHLEEARAAILSALNVEAAKAYGFGTPPERYVQLQFKEELEAHLERRLEEERHRWLFSRIIRYHAILADRAELAMIVVRNEGLARELAEKLDQGADFARLAREHSIHESGRNGGVLPPLPREALNPTVAEAAFSLPPGGRSGVLAVADGTGTRQFEIIKVIRIYPGRQAPFADVKDEIERGLTAKGVDVFEWTAWYLRLDRLYNVSISPNP
jgi:parvulin-like peptidyl-prolyl isomerase